MSGGVGDLSGFSMLELFRTEVENQAAILNEGLLAMEQAEGTQAVEPLMRAAHSIKGAARIVAQDAAVRLAHSMEDCFVAAQDGKAALGPDEVDILLRGVDMLIRFSQVPEDQLADWPGENAAELDRLAADLDGVKNSSAAKPAPSQPVAQESVEKSPAGPETDRIVRVTAENMSRLLGISGEFLVQTNWFQPFAEQLLKLRAGMQEIDHSLDGLGRVLSDGDVSRAEDRLSETRTSLANFLNALTERRQEFDFAQQRITRLADRLYREVIASRMRPLKDGAAGFPRMVRDLGRALGKKVRFEIIGSETEVDRDILEKLEAPLTHLLRNAVDHGLETPEERIAAGKNETGRLTLEAFHKAGMLTISIYDDGRGVDMDRLGKTIVARDLATHEMLEKMTDAEMLEFIFLPGFSTRKGVSEISGRGVGLDVLRNMLREVGGTVCLESTSGMGTRFSMQLPLTLSVIRSLLVEISSQPYAFPLSRVDRCLLVPIAELQQTQGRQYVSLGGKNVGFVPASQILDLPESTIETDETSIVILSDRTSQYGLGVDRFLGERDLVVLPLDRRLGKIPDVSAAAIMEDGSPLVLLDVDDLVRSADSIISAGQLRRLKQEVPSEQTSLAKKRILVVDDSITVREVQRRLLESRGYEVNVAVNGADGWNAVRSENYDLLISDVDMPRMNGIELLRLIKQDENLRNLPIIIVSYKDREEDKLRGLQAGANYYLTKSSFHDETLLEAVVDLIGAVEE